MACQEVAACALLPITGPTVYSPAVVAFQPDEHLQSLQLGNHAVPVFPQME